LREKRIKQNTSGLEGKNKKQPPSFETMASQGIQPFDLSTKLKAFG
jgi:hypothetical protein